MTFRRLISTLLATFTLVGGAAVVAAAPSGATPYYPRPLAATLTYGATVLLAGPTTFDQLGTTHLGDEYIVSDEATSPTNYYLSMTSTPQTANSAVTCKLNLAYSTHALEAVAADASGNAWILTDASPGGATLYEFPAPTGSCSGAVSPTATYDVSSHLVGISPLSDGSIAIDSSGNFYLGDTVDHYVYLFNSSVTYQSEVATSTSQGVTSLAVAPGTRSVYVSETSGSLEYIDFTAGSPSATVVTGSDQARYVTSVSFDSAGTMYLFLTGVPYELDALTASGATATLQGGTSQVPDGICGLVGSCLYWFPLVVSPSGFAAATWGGFLWYYDNPVETSFFGYGPQTTYSAGQANIEVGQTATVVPGQWTDNTTFSYEWYSCSDAQTGALGWNNAYTIPESPPFVETPAYSAPSGCSLIPDATGASFTVTSAQQGTYLMPVLVGTGVDGNVFYFQQDSSNLVAAPPIPNPVSNVQVTSTHASNGFGEWTATWTPSTTGTPATGFTCTLLYGYNNPSTFTVHTTTHSCTFTGLASQGDFGIAVSATTSSGGSSPVSGFSTLAKLPVKKRGDATLMCGKKGKVKWVTAANPSCPKGWHQLG